MDTIRWELYNGYLIPVLRTRRHRKLAREVSFVVFAELHEFTIEDFKKQFAGQEQRNFAIKYLKKLKAYGLVDREGEKYKASYKALNVGGILRHLEVLNREFSKLTGEVNGGSNSKY